MNIALYKPAYQSSTYTGSVTCTADRAVDGNRDPFFSDGSCASTDATTDTNPWWAVDLSSAVYIKTVTVFDRGDTYCCGK